MRHRCASIGARALASTACWYLQALARSTFFLLFEQKGSTCKNKAYYFHSDGTLVCRPHSNATAKLLPKDPRRKRQRKAQLQRHDSSCRQEAKKNKEAGRPGSLRMCVLQMMRPVDLEAGFVNVFPNNKHKRRQDGLALPSLSPLRLGPVDHGQPGLSPAACLQNLIQANKVFKSELSADGTPSALWFERQRELYEDRSPHWYKLGTTSNEHVKRAGLTPGSNAAACEYHVWVQPNGTLKRYDEVESRQFYCRLYEQLASQLADFKRLRDMRAAGTNLRICGYDAISNLAPSTSSIEAAYLDASEPFGHECVLFTMLALQPEEYPWRKHSGGGHVLGNVSGAKRLQEAEEEETQPNPNKKKRTIPDDE